jgi:hypothetical protein
LAALHIHFVETDSDQLADPNPGIEERFDQDHIRKIAAIPHRPELQQLMRRCRGQADVPLSRVSSMVSRHHPVAVVIYHISWFIHDFGETVPACF